MTFDRHRADDKETPLNQALLAEAQAIAHLGSWDLDLAAGRLTWSDETYRIFGLEPQQFPATYEAFLAAVHPEDRDAVDAAYNASLRENQVGYEIEHRVVRQSTGEIRYVHERCRHVRDETGCIVRSVGSVQDITERRLLEAELARQSAVEKAVAQVTEKLLEAGSFEEISLLVLNTARQLTDSSFGFVGYLDPETGNFVSDTMTRDIWDACHVADKTVVFEKFTGLWGWVLSHRRSLVSNDPERDHRSSGLPEGHIPIHRFLGVPALHGHNLVGMIALANSSRDYDDQDLAVIRRLSTIFSLSIQKKRAREAQSRTNMQLAESKGNLEAILSAVPVGILVFNPAARVVSDNPAARAIFGMTAFQPDLFRFGDYVGCSRRHTHPHGCGHTDGCRYCGINLAIAGILAGGADETPDREKEILRETDRENKLWVQFSAAPVMLQGQRCAILMVKDVTDQKKAEHALRKANLDLQSAVANARTFAEKAEAANRSKSLFISNMSHELRTPLNAVIGFSKLLAKDPLLTERQRSDVQVVLRSGQDLLDIINDILEISRIEAGRLEVKPVNFSIHELLMDLEAMFRSRCEAKGLHLVMERDDFLPEFLYGDRTKFKQIFLNLLSNAVKFTAEGGISVRVRGDLCQNRDLPRTEPIRLTIEVEDSGIGISEENLAAVFNPFEQADGPGHKGGTGLGLAICREYAALLGGDIRVDSEPGRGSCFRFSVVLRPGEAVAGTGGPECREVIGLDPDIGPVRVLVVDDDPDNQVLVKALLVPMGFEVHQAVNGNEGIAMFEQIRPHAVLMDMRMPDMDGYEATRRIKRTNQGLATPVIALTASAFEEGKQKTLDAGANAYLRKPFQHRELYDVIGQCLGLRYVCRDEDSRAFPALTAKTVSVLPAALRKRLWQAVEDGDMGLFSELLEPVIESHPELVKNLRRLADLFDYSRLDALLGNKEDTDEQ
jgi:PAS domain S-box-containing protein